MTKRSTKQQLLLSMISLLLCVSMLIGSTFAWFTDSVTSTNNIIKSGTLDVELEYSTDFNTWLPVTEQTNIFAENALWEPGYTEVVYLRVSNLGTLALKYNLGINIASEIAGTLADGSTFNLSDYIYFDAIEDVTAAYADRNAARAAATDGIAIKSGYAKSGKLLAKTATDAEYPQNVVALVVYMPETVGNEANYRGTQPVINLGLNVFATQVENETDSFDEFYDASAAFPGSGFAHVDGSSEYTLVIKNDSGTEIGKATFPAAAIADDAEVISLIIRETVYEGNITVGAGQSSRSYDIQANGLKSGNTTPVAVEFNIGKDLDPATVALYHYDTLIPSSYDTTTGIISFESADFSPFTVVYESLFLEVDGTDSFFAALEAGKNPVVAGPIEIAETTVINGNGAIITRAEGYTGDVFKIVAANVGLELKNVIVDGGAVWTGTYDETLQRGTVNSGIAATGALVSATNNSAIVLGDGAVLQNNCGANAVNLGTRIGATLTLDGGKVINNNSSAGAIWGGGHITIESGVISGNSSTGIAGAIRMVSNCNFTMNGGKIVNNKAITTGGAIYGYGASTYKFNGGEIAYNEASSGAAMWPGDKSNITVAGDIEIHDNVTSEIGKAFRLGDRTVFNMTGGKIYNHEEPAIYGWNPIVSIIGGEYADELHIQTGLGMIIGAADITGVVKFDLATNHNTATLKKDFNSFKFTVVEGTNFANFNMKPEAGYVYTEGDEDKLICLNEGYTTYWDAEASAFKIKAN